jgi:hypothetical protein
MGRGSHQIEMDRDIESTHHQHMVLDNAGPITRRTSKGPEAMAQEMTFEHNALTDVMFVDLCNVQPGDEVEVFDVGSPLGFPGQIQFRVNREKEVIYGLTIQNYSGLRRKLRWQYRMWSIQGAMRFLVITLLAGLRIDQSSHSGRRALCP